jgi:hypothetical protein
MPFLRKMMVGNMRETIVKAKKVADIGRLTSIDRLPSDNTKACRRLDSA